MRRLLSFALLSVVFVCGCQRRVALQPEPAAEIQFARAYFQLLRDSGATAVLPLMHPRTLGLPDIAANLTVIREQLNSSNAQLSVGRWTVRQTTARPRLTEVMFTAREVGAPSEVGIWIERLDARLVVETFFAGRRVQASSPP
jgi:hypothetical protein